MKKLAWCAVFVSLLAACGARPPPTPVTSAAPGGKYDLSSVAFALGCAPTAIAWSVDEDAQTPGQAGSVSPAGIFTAPSCGSPWVGGTVHVRAAGCSRETSVAIAIVEDLVSIEVSDAIVFPGTPQACHETAPNFTVPAGANVQWYARLSFTCRQVYNPDAPATWPPLCP